MTNAFRWCHIRHLNPQKKDPQRIKRGDKQYIEKLDHTNIAFPVSQKQYNKIEKQNSIEINVFGYKEKQRYPIHISKETFEDQMNLLLIIEDEKKHYVPIKDFDKFMYNGCCYEDKYSKPIQTYRGENAVYKFMERMLKEVEYCKGVVKKRFNKPLVMKENDELCFKLMDKYHICGVKYIDQDVHVRDHCHNTGKFRGSAHQECNLKLRIEPENIKIPVVFHNLRAIS